MFSVAEGYREHLATPFRKRFGSEEQVPVFVFLPRDRFPPSQLSPIPVCSSCMGWHIWVLLVQVLKAQQRAPACPEEPAPRNPFSLAGWLLAFRPCREHEHCFSLAGSCPAAGFVQAAEQPLGISFGLCRLDFRNQLEQEQIPVIGTM